MEPTSDTILKVKLTVWPFSISIYLEGSNADMLGTESETATALTLRSDRTTVAPKDMASSATQTDLTGAMGYA